MKILWLTNKIIPAVASAMGSKVTLVNEGWISQMFSQLCLQDYVDMNIICCGGREDNSGKTENFGWFTVMETGKSETDYDREQTEKFKSIINQVNPDIIHIWGTEYPHTYAMTQAARACGCIDKTVVSVQGLISTMTDYYYHATLPEKTVSSKTLYDRLRKTNIADQTRAFAARGKWEIAAIRNIKHIIGRTEWDKHCVMSHNPDINYHFCNETLRPEFYTGEWHYEECEKHSIFVSQATYPIKGLHLLIEALPAVIKKFPDTRIYVAGADIRGLGSLKNRLKCSAYGKYIRKSISQNKLDSHIHFTGRLGPAEMKARYLKSNAFICCSSIENSPNSVGEAMILGTPVICSDVGGVRSVFNAPSEGWTYRFEDTKALSRIIIELFSSHGEASRRGENARKHAIETHDPEKNFEILCSIYSELGGGNVCLK